MTPGLASRPSEDEALNEFLDSASSAPCALLVDGEAGIGKTTVWLAGLERARDRGFRVLPARAANAQSMLAYAPLAAPPPRGCNCRARMLSTESRCVR
jgi:hypothetical protein